MLRITAPYIIAIILFSCAPVREAEPPKPVGPIPSAAQLEWHRMEMNAFVHFSINTFTDKEWGYGDESPALFNPDSLDVGQWVSLFRDVGFKTVILTSKHHDGFCLWPSQFNKHNVSASPVRTDVVRAVSDACKEYGLHFGVYLSPWDRNHKDYGTPAYVDYYRNQLVELFTAYGPVFEMWFDGANGGDGYYGGAREKRSIKGSTYYEWPKTLDLVRSMEPNIIFFSDAGPGVRWVGNERGVAGETNWNTITPDTLFAGKSGIEQLLGSGSPDGTAWIPAETDVSIRPGWFYHQREDSLVKSPDRLFEIYLTSVGRGSTLLLNVPPDRHGRIHRNDVRSLMGFRKKLDEAFKTNHATGARADADLVRGAGQRYTASMLADGDPDTYWATDDGITAASATLEWKHPTEVRYVVLQEPIQLGQRVSAFSVEARIGGEWKEIGSGTTIGYKRIIALEPVTVDALRVNIKGSKDCVALSNLAAY